VEEKLLAGREYKICSAINALQHSVLEFHGIPFQPRLHNITAALPDGTLRTPDSDRPAQKGLVPIVSPGPWPDATADCKKKIAKKRNPFQKQPIP
jgi:hypothetical protein